MGSFSNLCEGTKSGGQWALDCAAEIAPLIKTVARAAAVLVAEDEHVPRHVNATIEAIAADEDVDLIRYRKLLEYADQRLIVNADSIAKAKRSAFLKINAKGDFSAYSSTTLNDNISGVWRMPIELDVHGHASTSMHGDSSKFLAMMNVPLIYTIGDNSFDLVNIFVSAMFANDGPQLNRNELHADSDYLISSAGLSVDMGNGNSFHCGHSFYRLPLGQGAANDAFHSAISVKYIATDSSQANFLADCKQFSFHQPLITGASRWMVTLILTWPSCSTARKAQDSFQANFEKGNNVGMAIQTNQLTGVSQLLKVTAPSITTPSAVRSTVQAAAMATLSALSPRRAESTAKFGDNKLLAEGREFPSSTAYVDVTDSSFLPTTSP